MTARPSVAETPPLAALAEPASDGFLWDVAWPRPDPPWPVRLRHPASGELAYALYDPEAAVLRRVRAEDDDRLPGLTQALPRGRLIAYRPGRRATVRLPGEPAVYVKVLRPGRAATAAQRARAVADALARRPGAPAIAELIEQDLRRGILVFREIPGRSLHQVGPVALPDVAASLVALHGAAPPDLPQSGRSGIGLGDYIRLTAEAVPERTPLLRGSLQHVAALPRGTPTTRLLHGDLHDKNVVVGSARIALLDLDLAHLGDPSDDVGNLAAHLVLRSLQGGTGLAPGRRAARGLIEAYRRAGGTASEKAVRRAGARTLLRLACLYQFRRRWESLTPALAEEAVRWAREGSAG